MDLIRERWLQLVQTYVLAAHLDPGMATRIMAFAWMVHIEWLPYLSGPCLALCVHDFVFWLEQERACPGWIPAKFLQEVQDYARQGY